VGNDNRVDRNFQLAAGENINFLAYFLKRFSEKGCGPFNDQWEALRKPQKAQRKKR